MEAIERRMELGWAEAGMGVGLGADGREEASWEGADMGWEGRDGAGGS